MEEMMMAINTNCPENQSKCVSMESQSIIKSISTTWKLYENPFFITQQPQYDHGQPNLKQTRQESFSKKHTNMKVSDFTFTKPLMESEVENGKSKILDMISELEYERIERKKLESMNKKLARELSEERKNREAHESLCKKLVEEISANKSDIDKLKKEIEEERKTLRVAEMLREERVQMKLSKAKHYLEEKLIKLNEISTSKNQENISQIDNAESITTPFERRVDCSSGEGRRSSLTEKSTMSNKSSGYDNPHIMRGIKGFVEFPKVIRAMGSKSHRNSGNKLECQKAQIRMIIKQRSPLKTNNTIITS